RDWDETLQYVCFAYNTAKQEYSTFLPFDGREPKLTIDLELGADPNLLLPENGAPTDYADRLLAELSAAREMLLQEVAPSDSEEANEKEEEEFQVIESQDVPVFCIPQVGVDDERIATKYSPTGEVTVPSPALTEVQKAQRPSRNRKLPARRGRAVWRKIIIRGLGNVSPDTFFCPRY
ncbi:Uncharacterized protein APZ42_000483, partial [Daphnia magna]